MEYTELIVLLILVKWDFYTTAEASAVGILLQWSLYCWYQTFFLFGYTWFNIIDYEIQILFLSGDLDNHKLT